MSRFVTTLTQDWKRACLVACIVAAAGILIHQTRLGEAAENFSYDLYCVAPRSWKAEPIILVEMDELAHRELRQDYGKLWDRKIHADFINRLRNDGAKLSVFDVFLSDSATNGLTDSALLEARQKNDSLAEALRNNVRVVIAADWQAIPGIVGGSVIMPFAPFAEAVSNRWGTVKLELDADLVVRRHYQGTPDTPGLPWAAAALIGAPSTLDAANQLEERWLRYYRPGSAVTRMSYHMALEQPTGFFRDRIVFIGGKPRILLVGEQADVFRTPHNRWKREYTPGVEIHATAFANLVRGDALKRLPDVGHSLIFGLWGVVVGFVLVRLSGKSAAIITVLAVFFILIGTFLLQSMLNIWWSWVMVAAVQPLIAFAAATIAFRQPASQPKAHTDTTVLPPPAVAPQQEPLNLCAFISHKRRDAYADSILQRLQKKGYDAYLDDTLGSGPFPEALQKRIDDVPNFILVCSPLVIEAACDSETRAEEWVLRELNYAIERNRHIIPVFVTPEVKTQVGSREVRARLPKELLIALDHQAVDYFPETYYDAAITRLIRFLEEGIKRKSRRTRRKRRM